MFYQSEQVWILILVTIQFLHKDPIVDESVSVQVLACCQTGNKPLAEPILIYY